MTATHIIDWLFNISMNIPLILIHLYLASYLTGHYFKLKTHLKYTFILSIIIGTTVTVLSSFEDGVITTISELSMIVATCIIFYIALRLIFNNSRLYLFGIVMMIQFIEVSIYLMTTFLLFDVFKMDNVNIYLLLTIDCYFFLTSTYIILILILKKIDFHTLYKRYFDKPLSAYITIVVLISATLVVNLSNLLFPKQFEEEPYLIPFFILITIIFALFYISKQQGIQEKMKLQQQLIIEQNNYLQALEDIQREMKKFQHDYKNVLAALYQYTENNDVESIRNYLNSSGINIDSRLVDKIKKTTNLANIEILELKSLILSKISYLSDEDIIFDLEIINKISNADIEIVHLVKCLGILLDNAIEACAKDDKIQLVLSNEDNNLVCMVINPLHHEVSLSNIRKEGYSTKGENRGLGLLNYHEILNSYSNVFKETKITDGKFIQILKIDNKVGYNL